MRTIAIDTSHAAGSVAACDGAARTERPLGAAGEHARLLAAAITAAAADLGWTPADADLVAVVRGPGSFTGLRVGVATAKGIAWAGGARLVGISAFEVVATRAATTAGWHDEPLALAFDAGRGDVFAATAMPMAAGGWRISAGELLPAERWIATLAPGSRTAGPALETLAERLGAAGHHVPPADAWFPSAATAAELGIARARAGVVDTPESLLPEYLRPSYADERLGSPVTP
ncbi:MAG: tRNA (adenosine(37)-N6)-threonylcarbamoyltransferase complex dimerization subunit type 1 TsaB [Planctomycetota bacterium]